MERQSLSLLQRPGLIAGEGWMDPSAGFILGANLYLTVFDRAWACSSNSSSAIGSRGGRSSKSSSFLFLIGLVLSFQTSSFHLEPSIYIYIGTGVKNCAFAPFGPIYIYMYLKLTR